MNSLAVLSENSLSLPSSVIDNLETYEDHLDTFVELEKGVATFAWWKADLLVHLAQKCGENSLSALSKDLSYPSSTVISYVRVARAFPPEKRLLDASFSLHFEASFADTYDNTKNEFLSEERFNWIEKAASEHMSTRKLKEAIQVSKDKPTTEEEKLKIEAKKKADDIIRFVHELLIKDNYKEILEIHALIFS